MFEDLQIRLAAEKAEKKGLGSTATSTTGATTTTANKAQKQINKDLKALYSKTNSGHEHNQHDEEELQRHRNDIDNELKAAASAASLTTTKTLRNKEKSEKILSHVEGRTALHVAAAHGEYDRVVSMLQNHDSDMLNSRDENGWQVCIHVYKLLLCVNSVCFLLML